jgi:hypothetical protein
MVWIFYISVNTEILKIFAIYYNALYFNKFKFYGCVHMAKQYWLWPSESSLHPAKRPKPHGAKPTAAL